MTKVNKMILASLMIAMTVALITSIGLVELTAKRELKARTINELNLAATSETLSFSNELKQTETVTRELNRLVADSFDMKQFTSSQTYMESYLKTLDAKVKHITEEAAINHSAYVFFLPEMNEKSLSIWYADLNGDGKVEKQPQFETSYFDGNKPEKQWFYGPILTKKGFWTEPYRGSVEADRSIIYFSYTEPVMVDGKIVAVVGNDYYFNKAKARIEKFKLNDKGYAFLIDQNDKILTHPTISSGVDMKYFQGGKYAPTINKIKSASQGYLSYNWESNEFKTMFFHHLDNGWVLIFTIADADMYWELRTIQVYWWAIGLLAVLGVVGIGFKVLKPVDNAIKVINESTMTLAAGQYDIDMPLEYLQKTDEFSSSVKNLEALRIELIRLSKDYNLDQDEMGKQLYQKQGEIEKINDYLELSLQQLQEKNGEMNIIIEKYENQIQRNQDILLQLIQSEEEAVKVYLLGDLVMDIASPIGNSVTMATYLRTEKDQIMRMIGENSLRKNDLTDFLNILGESLELIDRNMTIASKHVEQLKNVLGESDLENQTTFYLKDSLTSLFQAIVARTDQKQIKLTLAGDERQLHCNRRAFLQLFSQLLLFSLNKSYDGQTRGTIHIKINTPDTQTVQIVYEDFGRVTSPVLMERAIGLPLSSMLEVDKTMMHIVIASNILQKEFESRLEFDKNTSQGHTFEMTIGRGVLEKHL